MFCPDEARGRSYFGPSMLCVKISGFYYQRIGGDSPRMYCVSSIKHLPRRVARLTTPFQHIIVLGCVQ
jgi:hypothetical protein